MPGEYLARKEGEITFLSTFSQAQKLYTNVRYDSNWLVKVNGERVNKEIWDKLFIAINVPIGDVKVEFKYIPYDFFAGVFLSLLSTLGLIYLLYKEKF
ncbi:YfhO family protein [Patescibacteria group bacterium]